MFKLGSKCDFILFVCFFLVFGFGSALLFSFSYLFFFVFRRVIDAAKLKSAVKRAPMKSGGTSANRNDSAVILFWRPQRRSNSIIHAPFLDAVEFHRVLFHFIEVSLGFTGFYWVLLGFPGFYWVLLGFTGFYWVLLGFT